MKCLKSGNCQPTKNEAIWLLASLLLCLITVLSLATRANATISVPVPDHDLIHQSVAIVMGQIETIESFSDIQEGQIYTYITLTIDDVLTEINAANQILIWSAVFGDFDSD